MGWYEHTVVCRCGHKWERAFCSVNMTFYGGDTCPKCLRKDQYRTERYDAPNASGQRLEWEK